MLKIRSAEPAGRPLLVVRTDNPLPAFCLKSFEWSEEGVVVFLQMKKSKLSNEMLFLRPLASGRGI